MRFYWLCSQSNARKAIDNVCIILNNIHLSLFTSSIRCLLPSFSHNVWPFWGLNCKKQIGTTFYKLCHDIVKVYSGTTRLWLMVPNIIQTKKILFKLHLGKKGDLKDVAGSYTGPTCMRCYKWFQPAHSLSLITFSKLLQLFTRYIKIWLGRSWRNLQATNQILSYIFHTINYWSTLPAFWNSDQAYACISLQKITCKTWALKLMNFLSD